MIFSKSVFYDTSAWVALYDESDDEHEEATRTHQKIATERHLIVTSNFVFSETHAYFSRFPREALKIGEALRSSRILSYQRVSPEDEEKAWALLKKYKDKDFSFCDATSFILIERLKIPAAFSFDHHFEQYGISVVP